MRYYLLLLLFAFSSFLSAQKAFKAEYEKYDWEPEPVLHDLSDLEKKEGVVVLRDLRMMEYVYDQAGNLMMFQTRHMIMRLNSDKSIEENNKVYIPTGDVFEFSDLRARTITPAGKVIKVEKENIKDIENYENLGSFRIFAFEGVEKGAEVEFIYTIMRLPTLFGTEVIQDAEIRKNVEIRIVSAPEVFFTGKIYNSPVELKAYEEDGKNFLAARFDHLSPLKEERYAAYRSMLTRMEFKLSKNLNRGTGEVFPFSDAAARIWEDMHDLGGNSKVKSDVKTNIKKAKKAIKKFLDTLKLDPKLSQEDKIRRVESALKTKIFIKEDAPDATLEMAFRNNYCSKKDMMRILAASYTKLEIPYEIVLTTDRFRAFFDGSYETWNYLDHYLFYFPSVDQYMAPGEMFSRLGLPPSEWLCNDGLFVKGILVNKKISGYGSVKPIRCPEHKLSYDNIYADISFGEDLSSVNVHFKRILTGYSSAGLQSVFAFIPDERKSETTDAFLKILGEDSKLSNIKIQNLNEKSAVKLPVIMESDITNADLLEKAGAKYIFKVGDVIGPQAELYQEDQRKLPVENEYNRGYFREIVITLPEGYTVSGLDALNMNATCMYKDKVAAEFVANYSKHNNVIKIVIEENYREIRLPSDQFEPFRKVINAAADFNKITLVLEKK